MDTSRIAFLIAISFVLNACQVEYGSVQTVTVLPATLPPVWTETTIPELSTHNPQTPTPTPRTAGPEPLPTISFADRLAAAQPLIDIGMESNSKWDCLASMEAWTDVIEFFPDYGPAYYWRAYQAHCHVRARGDIGEYRKSIYDMLEDINLAIAIDPDANGDYYALRYEIMSALGSTIHSRVDYEFIATLALSDLETALYLGAGHPILPRSYVSLLSALGRCEEAIFQANRLQDLILPGEAPSAGVQTMLASAYLCKGQYWPALNAIDTAINIMDSEQRRYMRAMINYGLGRLQGSLADLDKIIEERPTYAGYRYLLRALIHYDLGQTDEALDDLQTGYFNTWEYGCAAALVEGLLSLDGNEIADAAEYFTFSEATCPQQSKPVWDRVLRELEKLGLDPVDQSSSAVIIPTPSAPHTPVDLSREIQPYPPSWEKTYASGTGRMKFNYSGHINMHISPRHPVDVAQVLSLTLELEPELLPKDPNIDLYLFNPTDRIWSMYPWEGKTIQILYPGRFIYPDGSLFLSTNVDASDYTTIKNVAVNLEIITDDGRRVNILDAMPTRTPSPPTVLAYATPIPYSISAPITINANKSVLLKLFPEPKVPDIDFVLSLTFMFSVDGQGQSTLDFSLWSPTSGGWGINQGDNKIAFGESVIQINYPDSYVSRAGEIYLSIRNYGSMPIGIKELSAAIEARAEDGLIIEFGAAQ